jgi:hypothetical protein
MKLVEASGNIDCEIHEQAWNLRLHFYEVILPKQ